MSTFGKSFFATFSYPGYKLEFGKPIPPVTKVDENGKDVIESREDYDHLWASKGESNGLDLYFEGNGFAYTIWVRSGDHSGKCFVVQPDDRLAVKKYRGEGQENLLKILMPESYFTQAHASKYFDGMYGLEKVETSDLGVFASEVAEYLLRINDVGYLKFSPRLRTVKVDKFLSYKIVVTEQNPTKPFLTNVES